MELVSAQLDSYEVLFLAKDFAPARSADEADKFSH